MVVNQEFACNEEINILPHTYAATDTDFYQVIIKSNKKQLLLLSQI